MKNSLFPKTASYRLPYSNGLTLSDIFGRPYTARRELTKKTLAFLPLSALLCFAFVKYALSGFISKWLPSVDVYRWLVREDGIVEYFEFAAYAVSVFLAFSMSAHFFRGNRRVYGFLYVLLALALFYVAGEEISWGQRIVHFKTSDYFLQHNYQKEMNTHNLRGTWRYIHNGYILIGLYGAFACFFLPRRFKGRHLFAPDSYLTFYFLPVAILYFYYDYVAPLEKKLFGDHIVYRRFIHDYDQEVAELLLAFGFAFFLAINKHRQTRAGFLPPDAEDEACPPHIGI